MHLCQPHTARDGNLRCELQKNRSCGVLHFIFNFKQMLYIADFSPDTFIYLSIYLSIRAVEIHSFAEPLSTSARSVMALHISGSS